MSHPASRLPESKTGGGQLNLEARKKAAREAQVASREQVAALQRQLAAVSKSSARAVENATRRARAESRREMSVLRRPLPRRPHEEQPARALGARVRSWTR